MFDWLLRQWNDVKGNVKFVALGFITTGIGIGAKFMTDGLPLWKQILLLLSFVWVIGLAIVLAWKLRHARTLLRNLAVREARRMEAEDQRERT